MTLSFFVWKPLFSFDAVPIRYSGCLITILYLELVIIYCNSFLVPVGSGVCCSEGMIIEIRKT